MKVKITFFLLAASVILVQPLYAQMTPHTVVYLDSQTKQTRAQAVLRVSRDQKNHDVIMLMTGQGTMEEYKDMRFQRRSHLLDEGMLKPLESEALFYDKKDKVIGGYRFVYDYDKEEVTYQSIGENKTVQKNESFPIQGAIADAINLPIFLEKFLPLHEGVMAKEFYFLSAEPKMYRLDIEYRGTEPIDLDGKQAYAKKIEIVERKGSLEDLTAKFFSKTPKTFVWFSLDRPYRWLQITGPEKGPASVPVLIKQLPD